MIRVLPVVNAPVSMEFDGFGRRTNGIDSETGDEVELLDLSTALVEHSGFVSTLGERVARFATVRHASYVHLRRLDRPSADRLELVSDFTPGWRVSELLEDSTAAGIPVDITVVIGLLRHLLPAVALYGRHNRDAAIGALSVERLIVTPQARLVIAEHAFGPALEKLNLGRDRLWRDLRVAMPPSAGLPRSNQRGDAYGIGVVALSLLLGRPLALEEFPAQLPALVEGLTEFRDGQSSPLSASFASWLTRALQFEVRTAFQSPSEMQLAFESVLASDRSYVTASAKLEEWVSAVGGRIDEKRRPKPDPEVLRQQELEREQELERQREEERQRDLERQREEEREREREEELARLRELERERAGELERLREQERQRALEVQSLREQEREREEAREREREQERQRDQERERELERERGRARALEQSAAAAEAEERAAAAAEEAPDPIAAAIASYQPPATPVFAEPEPAVDQEPAPAPQMYDEPAEEAAPAAPSNEYAPEAPYAAQTPYAPEAPEAPQAPQAPEAPVSAARSRTPLLAMGAVIVLLLAAVGWLFSTRGSGGLQAGEGELVVTSRPVGARVVVDGQERGVTPVTVALPSGAHVLEVQIGKAEPRVIPLTIQAGVQTAQYIELQGVAVTGALEIRSNPSGARVIIDGQPRGTTPVTVRELTVGDHSVVLEAGGRKVTQAVRIEPGSTAQLVVPIPRR